MGKTKIPYIVQPSLIPKILTKIREASTPDVFTDDYLKTKLNFKGGNPRQFIPLAKKLGLLDVKSVPSDLYKQFRNDATSGPAIAQALKNGYHAVFERNEYANHLKESEFRGLLVEITGLDSRDRKITLMWQTFDQLKKHADFEKKISEKEKEKKGKKDEKLKESESAKFETKDFDLNLSYTINLVLPKTDDPAVFNAIFHSLRDNLLRK